MVHLSTHKLLLNTSDECREGREEVTARLASAKEFIMDAAVMSLIAFASIKIEKKPRSGS